ncbi:ribosomal protein S15 [Aphanomyces cochlioides]|nr:ribosomal protein S15 [Aphanomyces cochlioides]
MLRTLVCRVGASLAPSRSAAAAFSSSVGGEKQRVFNYVAPAPASEEDLRMGFKKSQIEGVPEEVVRSLSLENASQAELNKLAIQKAIAAFQRFPGDTGSSEVQIAILTQKIKRMTEHFRDHKKDNHSRRGLQAMISQRKKLLQYLRRENLTQYRAVVAALGLRFT